MSKIIKSDQYVEALPCRLEPVDVDAFFINENEEAQSDLPEEQEGAPEEMENSGQETGENKQTVLGTDAGELDLSNLVQVARKIGSIIDGEQDQEIIDVSERSNSDSGSEPAEKGVTGVKVQPQINLDYAKKEAESIFSGAKEKAARFTEDAQNQAEKIFNQAKQEADTFSYSARQKAGEITKQASRDADLIVNTAKEQAEKALEKARRQGESVVAESEQKAKETVEKAGQEAAVILETARQEAVGIKEQAKQEGYQTGYQEGQAGAKKELEQQLTQVMLIAAAVEEVRAERILSSEPELLKLAVAIAEQIIGEELKVEPSQQLSIVRSALTRVPTINTVTLRINPEDRLTVAENLPILQKAFNEPKPVHLVEDPSIIAGSCFVETDQGNIDPRIKSQLEQIMIHLLKVGQLK